MTKLRPQGERQERRHTSDSPSRTLWASMDLSVVDEPLLWALVKYRQKRNRARVTFERNANLISSITDDGRQMPILDLDFPHKYSLLLFGEDGRAGFLQFYPPDTKRATRVQRAFYRAGLTCVKDARHTVVIEVPHQYVESTHSGHGHLYIDVPMSKWRWLLLMARLYRAGVIELGYFVWSIRRGGNFVRLPGVEKMPGRESGNYTYGWLFKLRNKR